MRDDKCDASTDTNDVNIDGPYDSDDGTVSGHADDERSEDADCLSEDPDSEGSGSSDSSPGSSDADASDREMPIKSGSTDRGSAKADKPSGLADKPSVLADHYKEILISPDLSDQKDPDHARARETNPNLPPDTFVRPTTGHFRPAASNRTLSSGPPTGHFRPVRQSATRRG